MFWGLIMEPGKKYSQTVEKSFHVSQAALDLDSAQNHPVQVLLGFENRNYLLCTLNKDKWVQVPLDLNFQVGDKVSFATNGPGHVHLTGYLVPEDDYDMDLEEEEDAEDEEQEDEEVPELQPINNKKRKASNKIEQKPKKTKSETAKLLENSLEDDTDEDDSDVNLTDLLETETGEEEAEEEEEDDDEDGGSDDDDDEDDDDEEEEEEEVEEQPVQKKEKPKQNGIVKPEKQKGDKQKLNKQEKQQKQQQQSPKQQGKKKTISGGVVVEDIKVGDGPAATAGRQVQVYYEGRLQSNNKVFDATRKGNGFKFRLGKQEVIKGWDVGIAGMKVGGKRRITCPPHMAYGAQGSPPVIPPQSTLIFEVELKNVK